MTCQTCNTFFSKSPYLRVGEQHVIKDGKIIHAKYKYYSPITKKSHWRVVYACR